MAIFIERERFFPRRAWLTWSIMTTLFVGVIMLWSCWVRGRGRDVILTTLNTASLVLAAAVAIEMYMASDINSMEAVHSYPYPYRGHGFVADLQTHDSINHDRVTSNDSGLREKTSIKRKPDGVMRILILGGSAIFGVGSADDKTVPAQLQVMLDTHLASRPLKGTDRIEVINAGQGWYNSTQELIFLSTELVLYEPDLVIVIDGYNDAHHTRVWRVRPPSNAVVTRQIHRQLRMQEHLGKLRWIDSLGMVLESSNILSRITASQNVIGLRGNRESTTHVSSKSLKLDETSDREAVLNVMMHRLVMNWTLMHRLTNSFQCRSLFALQPCMFAKDQLSEKEKQWVASKPFSEDMRKVWTDLQRYIEAQAKNLHLPVFDADRLVSDSPNHLLIDYCHMTPAGNKMLAEAIFERVKVELERWPCRTDWSGVRYPHEKGDPVWRPNVLSTMNDWE